MKTLVDTNILARLIQPSHPQHQQALGSLLAIRKDGHDPCIVPQVLYELWVICTRPTAQNGLGLDTAQARGELARAKKLFPMFRDERAIFPEWERLVIQYDVKGKKAHDARLVAAMQRHGLTQILTFNDADFARYQGITTLKPTVIVSEALRS